MKGWGLDLHQVLPPSRTWKREQGWSWQVMRMPRPVFFRVSLRLPLGGVSRMATSSFFSLGIPSLLTSTRRMSAFLIRAARKTPGLTSGLCGFSSPRFSPRPPTGITASLSAWLKSITRLSGNSRKPASPAGGPSVDMAGKRGFGGWEGQPLPAWDGATVTFCSGGGLRSCTW